MAYSSVRLKGLSKWLAAAVLLLPLAVLVRPSIFFETFPRLEGTASWYGGPEPGLNRHTASGEIFDASKAACASWDFPLGTLIEIINKENGKSVVCRVNDRGPAFFLNRTVDLTKSSFEKIADPEKGVIKVKIRKSTG